MKLLIVTDKVGYKVGQVYYSTGGFPKEINAISEIATVVLLAAFEDRKIPDSQWEQIDSRVICLSTGKIRRFGAFPPPILAILRIPGLIENISEKYNVDVVLLKGPSEISLFSILKLSKLQIPSIYHYSLDWIEDVSVSGKRTWLRRILIPYFHFVKIYRRILLKLFLPRANALATVSTIYAQKLSQYRQGVIYLLPTTFTISENQIVQDISAARSIEKNNFLFVGRIDRNKNLQLIVRALHLLKIRFPDRRIVVDIVGSGKEVESVMRLAEELGVADQLNHIGYVNNSALPQFYVNALATLLPSFSETLGKVIIESFACGTPAIASRVGGVPDILIDGVNGFFIDPYSAESLAEKMALMMQNKAFYDKMRSNCLETSAKFTKEATLRHWINTIDEISECHKMKVSGA